MQQTNDILENAAKPGRAILRLAWPVFLEQILVTLVQYVDTAMVGSMGANATAAIAINQSPIDLINGLILGLGVGITALVSRFAGAGERETVARLTRQALTLTLVVGGALSAVFLVLSPVVPIWMGADAGILSDARSYLAIVCASLLFKTSSVLITAVYRGLGNTVTPLKVNLIVNLINIVGNCLLIYPSGVLEVFHIPMWGAGLGVTGAALSTSLSTVLGGVMLFTMVFRSDSPVIVTREDDFHPDLPLLRHAFTISVPTILERVVMSLGKILVTATVAGLGTLSLAAHHLVITTESLSFMPSFAFSVAATTLVGQSLGAGRRDLANSYAVHTIRLAVVVMTFAGVGLYFGAGVLISVFSSDPQVLALGADCLRLTAFVQPIQVISVVITGCLRGAGDAKWPFYIVLLSMWSVRILLSMVAVHLLGLGLYAVWVCVCLDVLARCLLFLWRFCSGRWQHALDSVQQRPSSAQ